MRLLFSVLVAGFLLLAFSLAGLAKPSGEEIKRLLPKEVGVFKQMGSIELVERPAPVGLLKARALSDSEVAGAKATYVSAQGGRFIVEVARFSQDSDAYSSLTIGTTTAEGALQIAGPKLGREVGTVSLATTGQVTFFKGPAWVRVTEIEPQNSPETIALARLFADRLESGEGDIPVLVKHLPQWEQAQDHVVYIAGFGSLSGIVANQPILEAIKSEGDGDAVVTYYGKSQFLVVEFNTPQLAADNDRAITARIKELQAVGQPVPSAYRRVGNYSIFVFNAETEQAANQLIDQVKYEQVVQWLGDNPNLLQQAQRAYYETTAGVFIAVIKASGLSLLACLAVGGLLGGLLFSRRRAQQRQAEAFSDAGGMLRLNIDEMTTPDSSEPKLLGTGH